MRSKPLNETLRNEMIQLRGRNLVIDAGAGTGKTKLLVDRLLDLVAPAQANVAPLPLERIAVLTFTRRAAGELRFRIRSAMLKALSSLGPGDRRHDLLQEALNQIDTAFIGTIHSFADRLLRMRPIEARLSPQYEIQEGLDDLAEETFRLLLHAAEAGTLAGEVSESLKEPAAEAQQTLRDFRQVGIRARTKSEEYHDRLGLDRFIRQVIEHRDVTPRIADSVPVPDVQPVLTGIQAYVDAVRGLTGSERGQSWLHNRRNELRMALDTDDKSPLSLLRIIQGSLGNKPSNGLTLGNDFGNEDAAWRIWNDFWGGGDNELTSGIGALVRPLHDWMGARLVRTIPVILDLYEKIKVQHEVVDYLDLLIKLRDLLREPTQHGFYRAIFDHIMVDEFQDTDPLQSDILLYLTSDALPPNPDDKPTPAPGRLTIVGDPKQSIYRFRRADIAAYDAFCAGLSGATRHRLNVNFRSTPGLIEFFNAQLSGLLGRDGERTFDPKTGRAFYQNLQTAFEENSDRPVAVHQLQYPAPARADRTDRPAEAQALVRHLYRLKESRQFSVRDADQDGTLRPLDYGDIAVVARSTYNLPILFAAFDQCGIPYSARGGTLFLQEPLIRRFNLALRALADPDDGVAQTALFSPPFFALNPGQTAAGQDADAREIVSDLRTRRFSRAPVATALDLLYQTGFARALALMPNGEQKLDAVRHLINVVDRMAQTEGLTYDAATERLREWADDPGQMDAPSPIDRDAVQVLTIHQAKGLEFPVVAIWDGFDKLGNREKAVPWLVSRDGRRWSIVLDGFRAAFTDPSLPRDPQNSLPHLAEIDATFADAERLRLYYVAATRARDLLIVPDPRANGNPRNPETFVCARILNQAAGPRFEVISPDAVGTVKPLPEYARPVLDSALTELLKAQQDRWRQAVPAATKDRLVPQAFTTAARKPGEKIKAKTESREEAADLETSRFGPAFGRTVHRALAQMLAKPSGSVRGAVDKAVNTEGLTEHREEAVQDVERALAALRAEGILDERVFRAVEYPLVFSPGEATLLVGSADLVAKGPDRTWLIDYKTDAPGTVADYPRYAEQVRLYARALAAAGISPLGQIRAGLLFTANADLQWVEVNL